MTADDMLVRLEGTVDDRDLTPFRYPPRADLRRLGVPLGLSRFVRSVERRGAVSDHPGRARLGGRRGRERPAELSLREIECYMQGVRDYIKYLKRGYTRPTHLTSIDIRHDRIGRDEAMRLINDYEGQRPPSLDLSSTSSVSTRPSSSTSSSRTGCPVDGGTPVSIGRKPHDFDRWERHGAMPRDEAERQLKRHLGRFAPRRMIGVVDTKAAISSRSARPSTTSVPTYVSASTRGDLADCERVVLPGVGAFVRSWAGWWHTVSTMRCTHSGHRGSRSSACVSACSSWRATPPNTATSPASDGSTPMSSACNRPTRRWRVPHVGWHDTRHTDDALFASIPQGPTSTTCTATTSWPTIRATSPRGSTTAIASWRRFARQRHGDAVPPREEPGIRVDGARELPRHGAGMLKRRLIPKLQCDDPSCRARRVSSW